MTRECLWSVDRTVACLALFFILLEYIFLVTPHPPFIFNWIPVDVLYPKKHFIYRDDVWSQMQYMHKDDSSMMNFCMDFIFYIILNSHLRVNTNISGCISCLWETEPEAEGNRTERDGEKMCCFLMDTHHAVQTHPWWDIASKSEQKKKKKSIWSVSQDHWVCGRNTPWVGHKVITGHHSHIHPHIHTRGILAWLI